MTKRKEIYRCLICGNVVEVINSGAGELVCCGKPMIIENENSDDSASKEKHVPYIKDKKVSIGKIEHPMEESHYIAWIEAKSKEGRIERVYLNPGEKPETEFNFEVESARAFCNLHGLWKGIKI
jgi:superoxide reductase